MKNKHTILGIELLRALAHEGYRIFSLQDAKTYAKKIGMKETYVVEAIHLLNKEKWIQRLKRGLYAFSFESGFQSYPHDFEIAQALVQPSAISHWTAMHYHHLTQQTPNRVFSIFPKGTTPPRHQLLLNKFQFIQVKESQFIGLKQIWMDEAKIYITDCERTLIDGLQHPNYCGDFYEVLDGFKFLGDKMDYPKLIFYAKSFGEACIKRLGWVLDKLESPNQVLDELLETPIKGFRLLNPTGEQRGLWNKKWMIRENI